jgi:NAD(P)-dependent dehydrogenase (short-subunit alcohol dehydrogenase family)
MNTDKNLQGQIAIVTGASRNLGRALAEMLARRGASVVVHWNAERSRADAEETARRVREAGAVAELAQADLASAASTATVIDRCFDRFGRLDILINNAGIIVKKPFAELTDQDFEQSFAINTRAPFILMRAAASRMHEGGRIINVGTSILGCSFPFYGVYAASKAPLEHMTRALAKELSQRKISVNTIAPGALDTPFFYGGETQQSAEAIKNFTGGLGQVSDVVPLVEYLVSPSATWMSGQTLFINGGFATR